MEVTALNFNNVLPQLETAINSSTFISIDCELTGLNVTRDINAFDTPKEYYEKIKRNCKDFLVIQYGLSMFKYDPDENKFKQQSYNFYIFRRTINRNIPDHRFLCQSSSIHFLISQGFDFNKLFKEGIPYLNEDESEKYKYNIEDAFKKRMGMIQSQQNGTQDIIPIPDNARDFINDCVKMITDFLETDEEELVLPRSNAFFRRLVYQTKSETFANKISLETRLIDNERRLFVTRLKNRKEEEENETMKFQQQLEELEDLKGFTKVLQMIVRSDKLIIGHNLCLDFLHSIDKFLTYLPDDYDEFKTMSQNLFSKVLDTKYMSSIQPFNDLITSNVLKHLLDTVSEEPFKIPEVEIEEGAQGYSLSDAKEHEAGYDAYITGLSFLSMWKYLGTSEGLDDKTTFGSLQLLEPYMNKIFLMTLTDNQYIHLAGDDLKPSRDHVFYLTFPKEWKLNNISQLFSPFGNIYVSWIDETSAFVGLYKKDQAAVALSTLSQSDTYSITTFAKRKAFLAGISTPMRSPWKVKRRGSAENNSSSKKRRTDSFKRSGSFSNRSIDPIEEEEMESEDNGTPKKSIKLFDENDAWE